MIEKLKQENPEVEDNIDYIKEIHKKIARTPFYVDVVKNDPFNDEELEEEDFEYAEFFEDNYNEIGNNMINYVQFLCTNLEDQMKENEEMKEKL